MNWKTFAIGVVVGVAVLPALAVIEIMLGQAVGPLICLTSIAAGLF